MTVSHDPPTIRCCDLWPPGTLTADKLGAYKRMIDRGDIRIRRVVTHRHSGHVTVEYWSNLPHAWTLDHLKELSRLEAGEQTQMEV